MESGLACDSSPLCGWDGPIAHRDNQAIVCLGKATTSYCNYLWKKTVDVFGRGWCGGRQARGRTISCPIHSQPARLGRNDTRLHVWVMRVEKFRASSELVPSERGPVSLFHLRLLGASSSNLGIHPLSVCPALPPLYRGLHL